MEDNMEKTFMSKGYGWIGDPGSAGIKPKDGDIHSDRPWIGGTDE
jgi:hypothetical protein